MSGLPCSNVCLQYNILHKPGSCIWSPQLVDSRDDGFCRFRLQWQSDSSHIQVPRILPTCPILSGLILERNKIKRREGQDRGQTGSFSRFFFWPNITDFLKWLQPDYPQDNFLCILHLFPSQEISLKRVPGQWAFGDAQQKQMLTHSVACQGVSPVETDFSVADRGEKVGRPAWIEEWAPQMAWQPHSCCRLDGKLPTWPISWGSWVIKV